MNAIENRLEELGIMLPEPPKPVAAYVPFVRTGNSLHVSGQLPFGDDGLATGKLGDDVPVADGHAAARTCGINLLAQVRAACNGDLERLVQVVKLTWFVNSTPDFRDHPSVINGASEFFGNVLGDAGRHARSAIGVSSLPLGASVEVEGIFVVR